MTLRPPFGERELRRSLILFGLILIVAASAVAKRLAPKAVPPVTADHVRYSVEGDGRDQYVVAQDVSTDKVLWKALIFHTRIDPFKEEDVQWVFVTELKLRDNTLSLVDEKSRCYLVDLATHKVRKKACASVASP
jgi:hypothetical protein